MDLPLTPEEYVELRDAVDWPTMSHGPAASALAASLAVAIERDDEGRLIGVARAIGDGWYVVVVDVMVRPEVQDHGVAHRVLSRLLEDPVVAGAGHLSLFSAPDATDLYEEFGFASDGSVFMRRGAP